MVSEAEGLPIALLEAMGHGIVPIVSDIDSGMSTVIENGRNGFLINFRDLASYADRIVSLCKDAESYGRCNGRVGRRASVTRPTAWARLTKRRSSSCLIAPSRSTAGLRTGPFPVMESCRSPYPSWLRGMKSRVRHIHARGRTLKR